MIVDAFIAQNPLPEAWGANDSWRFAVAVFVVEMAHMPELVNVKPDFGRDGSGEELRRQIEFCTRFAQAPDYFCRLVQFARDQYQRQSQLDIATEFLRNGRFEKSISSKMAEILPTVKLLLKLCNYGNWMISRITGWAERGAK